MWNVQRQRIGFDFVFCRQFCVSAKQFCFEVIQKPQQNNRIAIMIIGMVNTPPCNKLETVVPGKISAVVPGKIIGMVNKNVAVKKVERQWKQTAARGEWAKATMELRRAFSIPDGMDQTQWEAVELQKPYVKWVQLTCGRFIHWCKLCGKSCEFQTHWAGNGHLYQVLSPNGKAKDPNQWTRPILTKLEATPKPSHLQWAGYNIPDGMDLNQ